MGPISRFEARQSSCFARRTVIAVHCAFARFGVAVSLPHLLDLRNCAPCNLAYFPIHRFVPDGNERLDQDALTMRTQARRR